MVKADWKRWNFRSRLKVDRVSIERNVTIDSVTSLHPMCSHSLTVVSEK